MTKAEKIRRKREQRFVAKTLYISSILFSFLFIMALCAYAIYPTWLARQIHQDINACRLSSAASKMEKLAMRNEELAADLQPAYDYAIAKDLLAAGKYDQSYAAFLALDGYSDSSQLALECRYRKACVLYDNGNYAEAVDLFYALGEYQDSSFRYGQCLHAQASVLEQSGDLTGAFVLYRELGDHEDAPQRMRTLAVQITGIEDPQTALNQVLSLSMEELAGQAELTEARKSLRPGVLAVGGRHTVGLKSDGTVLATGYNGFGQCNVADWSHVIMVDAGALHTVALRDNGTVAAAGSNEFGQCNVQSWENVVEIACGDYATFARFADGTVAAVGYLTYQLDGWRNTTALAAGSYQVCALQASGSLYASHESARQGNLTGLIDMDCHIGGAVGITRDGHVAASFAAMPEWDNMIDLSMGSAMILGIRADGTVAVHRYYASAAPGVETVENAVAVAAGGAHCAVLDADGRVHAFGTNESGQCDTEDWDLK